MLFNPNVHTCNHETSCPSACWVACSLCHAFFLPWHETVFCSNLCPKWVSASRQSLPQWQQVPLRVSQQDKTSVNVVVQWFSCDFWPVYVGLLVVVVVFMEWLQVELNDGDFKSMQCAHKLFRRLAIDLIWKCLYLFHSSVHLCLSVFFSQWKCLTHFWKWLSSIWASHNFKLTKLGQWFEKCKQVEQTV